MLHLRLRVPDRCARRVVDLLTEDATVTNVAVVEGAFRQPPGWLVEADVARESATSVIGQLRHLGVQHEGSISIERVDTLLSDDAVRAERAAPGAPDDGVVWESVEQRLRQDSRLTWVFVCFMTLAALIAGVGRITDQPVLIVGAMVVGPEFTAIAAFCFALARPRPSMAPVALGTLAAGFGVALAVSTLVWTVSHSLGAFTVSDATTGRLTHFVVSPDGWSLAVALLAGVAGTLSLSTAKSEALVGVFISVTTIPALGAVAVCVACGAWHEAGSSLLQLGVNLLGIVLAGTTTLLVQRAIWGRVGARGVNLGR